MSQGRWPILVHVHSYSMFESPGIVGNTSTGAATAWPAAKLALYIPISLFEPTSYSNFFMFGTTASGNIDLGLYSASGLRLASTGLTAIAFTSNIQIIAATAAGFVDGGAYYLGISVDNTTATIDRFATPVETLRAVGVLQEDLSAGDGTLPATATFATVANAYYPMVGMTNRSFI